MLELLQCGKRCGTQTAEIENRRWRELEMGLAVKHCPWKRGNEEEMKELETRGIGRCQEQNQRD